MGVRATSKEALVVAMQNNAVHTGNDTVVAGSAIDLQGFDTAEVQVDFGTWNASDTIAGSQVEIGLQHSDDTVSGNFVDVPNDMLSDTVAGDSTVAGGQTTGVFTEVTGTSDDNKVATTSYLGGKRYIRYVKNTQENVANGIPLSITCRKGRPHVAPTSQNS